MADLRVQLFGPLLVLKDGVPVRLRTRQQGLLLARLAAHRPNSIRRTEMAGLLWPEARRANALAYLRRALKELREAGIDIRSEGDHLRLSSAIESDCDGPRFGGSGRKVPLRRVLDGIEHPVADEVRALLRRRFGGQDRRARVEGRARSGGEEKDALGWIGERLLHERPDVVRELVLREWDTFRLKGPPAAVLSLLLRLVKATPEDAPERVRLLAFGGDTAMVVTKLGLAQRLLLQALEGARRQGDYATSAVVQSSLVSLKMLLRDWRSGIEYGRQAIEAATRSGDPVRIAVAHHNLASTQWHSMDFSGAAENYQIAWNLVEGTPSEETARLLAQANLVYLWAVFGTEIGLPIQPFGDYAFPIGYGSGVESYLQFATGFGLGDLSGATEGVIRLMEVAAEGNMEGLFCKALDCAAFIYGRLDLSEEAAACVRLGSRLRFRTSNARSPAERFAVRRHVGPPFFGERISRLMAEWESSDLEKMGARIAARLRAQ